MKIKIEDLTEKQVTWIIASYFSPTLSKRHFLNTYETFEYIHSADYIIKLQEIYRISVHHGFGINWQATMYKLVKFNYENGEVSTNVSKFGYGNTIAEAVLKCFIASIHNSSVEIPKELINV